jgi:acyl-coenzyme A thioesterase PaaI-like protein
MSLSSLHTLRDSAAAGRWDEIESFFNDSPQLKIIGATVDLSDPVKPRVLIEKVTDAHRGGIGSQAVNGGVISMLIDLAIGLLGLPFSTEGMTATTNLSIHFVKPLMANRIILESETSEVVGNRIFGKVRVMNERREICSFASGIVAKGINS